VATNNSTAAAKVDDFGFGDFSSGGNTNNSSNNNSSSNNDFGDFGGFASAGNTNNNNNNNNLSSFTPGSPQGGALNNASNIKTKEQLEKEKKTDETEKKKQDLLNSLNDFSLGVSAPVKG